MTSQDCKQPGRTPQAEADRQSRLDREASALRENLRRRKQQTQARAAVNDVPDNAADRVIKRQD